MRFLLETSDDLKTPSFIKKGSFSVLISIPQFAINKVLDGDEIDALRRGTRRPLCRPNKSGHKKF